MNYKLIIVALSAIFFQISHQQIFAVKAYPHPITVTQPDGTTLTIRMQGDEFKHHKTTLDGYLLKTNTKGFLTYANINTSGELVESEIIATEIDNRSVKAKQFLQTATKAVDVSTQQKNSRRSRSVASSKAPRKAFPLNGSPKTLIILVNFTDKSFVTANAQTAYTNLLNQDGYSTNGGTGSARDYFMASSYGKFSPEFDVVGPYLLPNNMAYYGGNDDSDQDLRPDQMIADACTAANNDGVDFTQYDTDGNGSVDNIFVYYAGYNEAENGPANTVWPHRWSLSDAGYSGNKTFDGKVVDDYACTSELKGSSGTNMCGIGTFCHEFGHVLGLPDYYHTENSDKSTLDEWSIMDLGSYNNSGRTPPTYSVYDRFYLGYLTPEQVSTTSSLTLNPIYQGSTEPANTNNQAYLFSATTHNLNGTSPSPNEFFLVEYRKKTGWDTYLPSEGMLIWHIDYNATAWNNNRPNNYTGSSQTASSHMRMYLQPLSGSSSTPGTAFTSGSFTPTTWSGTNINRAISSITKTNSNVTFNLTVNAPTITTSGTLNEFTTSEGVASETQSIGIGGSLLSSALQITLQDQNNFDIKLSTASTWGKTVSITPSSGNVNATLQIRYNPTAAGNHTNQLIITSTGAQTANVNLSGSSIDPNAPSIVVGKIDGIISFPKRTVNGSAEKTLNIKTTDLVSNLAVNLSGTDANMFHVSTSTVAKEDANGFTGINITVTYIPTAIGPHTATLTISGGGLQTNKVITLNGEGI